MPELPEVEVIKNQLTQNLLQKENSAPRIIKFDFYRKDLRYPIPIKKIRSLEGATLLRIDRRAKYLLFQTDAGAFLSHLGMSGNWCLQKENLKTHDHVRIQFSNGLNLVYSDPRRFGSLEFWDAATEKKRFSHLGYEPFDEKLTAEVLQKLLKNKKVPIKAALMQQEILVGVGNIYASEALFAAKVHPLLSCQKLKLSQAEKILESIRLVLGRAIKSGGSSISDFKNLDQQSGYFQNQHAVYGRAGLQCTLCESKIKMKVVAGRSTFWCPHCQTKA
jgi:formamidopyrimidine-DNA glycosylase